MTASTTPMLAKGFHGDFKSPIVQFGDLVTLNYGKSLPARDREPGNIRVYGSNGQCGWHNAPLRDGPTVILGRKGQGPLGVEWCPWPFWVIDTAYFVTTDPERIDLRYFYYLADYIGLNHLKHGTSNPSLQREVFYNQAFPLPDLPTQRKITGILSAYDGLIENNLRRIRILEEMAQSLYREWFVHFRFPGHESTPMVDSPLGPIPKGWEVKTVEDAVKRFPVGKKYSNKTVNETGTVPVLDQGKSGIIGYHDDEPGFKASEENPVIVFANHTCYQRIIQYPFSAIQNVLPFRSNSAIERNLYWLHWATKDVIEFNDYKGHWPEFIAKKLIFPPTEVCDAFGKIAETSIRSIYCLERRNQTLRQTRDLLLPKLLSGQHAP
ncbi:restriction endonuclease subunit S [Verrucomicrobiales bacterium BCK34]|nr:restriction endonuclease subunit S [Verrucomicrobiales bacterium BCK34]